MMPLGVEDGSDDGEGLGTSEYVTVGDDDGVED
eukprot:CAMPEP_0194255496 /NCGR_PEP_ID=MMETSP0158-20130606/34593_1 /TAXON_ID=33649 /ORGANISM="Thalassionema nitzschioides, Strain L26-B" /LENGTH=32 /DNA_ID= /DNA_START= /DNA_END= /DNA_ORIENTATION=